MTIFTMFVGVVMSTFLLTSRTLREANEVRKVYTEARFLMDRLTQDVRLLGIDYACLRNGLAYQTVMYAECTVSGSDGALLPLISEDGNQRTVYRFENGVFSMLNLEWNPTLFVWQLASGTTGFESFETRSVALERVAFRIFPEKSPYEHLTDNDLQYQPSVHVEIDARPTSDRLNDVVPVQLKTTVSSRLYR